MWIRDYIGIELKPQKLTKPIWGTVAIPGYSYIHCDATKIVLSFAMTVFRNNMNCTIGLKMSELQTNSISVVCVPNELFLVDLAFTFFAIMWHLTNAILIRDYNVSIAFLDDFYRRQSGGGEDVRVEERTSRKMWPRNKVVGTSMRSSFFSRRLNSLLCRQFVPRQFHFRSLRDYCSTLISFWRLKMILCFRSCIRFGFQFFNFLNFFLSSSTPADLPPQTHFWIIHCLCEFSPPIILWPANGSNSKKRKPSSIFSHLAFHMLELNLNLAKDSIYIYSKFTNWKVWSHQIRPIRCSVQWRKFVFVLRSEHILNVY